MTVVYLDRGGLAPIIDGTIEIRTEVDFLIHATDNASLFIRGERLCRWAEEFYAGRGIQPITITSVATEIQALCPALEREALKTLLEKYAEKINSAPRPLSIHKLLQSISPGAVWEESPSLLHLAEFVLWMTSGNADSLLQPILQAWIDQLQFRTSDVQEKHYLAAAREDTAKQFLLEWLGAKPSQLDLRPFPLPVPADIEKSILVDWRIQIISTGGEFFLSLLDKSIPFQLLKGAARELSSYYIAHPDRAKKEIADRAMQYLELSDQRRLAQILPPKLPASLPASDHEVIPWFRREYLPYRYWVHLYGTEPEKDVANKLARQFAEWYLDIYPSMLMGNSLIEQTSFKRVSNLSQERAPLVTLIVALDGLGVIDAQQLMLEIKTCIPRLTVLSDGACFSPLPTITEFCKKSLTCGQTPAHSIGSKPIGTLIPEGTFPASEIEQASPGDVIIWYIGEPDRTYHKSMDHEVLRSDIESTLKGIVDKISKVCEQVPGGIPLKLIITADHGRLLSSSKRKYSVPSGMTAHGRTAWGPSPKNFPSNGYIIEGNLVYLNSEAFGLPADALVPLDEDAFLTSDGRTGTEWFTHGGLYPEEVIIPWVELLRDAIPPEIEIKITGHGTTNDEGNVHIYALNANEEAIFLEYLELRYEGKESQRIAINQKIGDRDILTLDKPLKDWPSQGQANTAIAKVRAKTSKGLTFFAECTVKLTSEEMYTSSEDILKDLF